MSVVPSGTVWQPRRDFGVMPGASSSSSSSASVASLQDSRPSRTMTWQVEQAQTPPHAWSRPALMPSEISRILPGRPLCPYGIFSGSTSMDLPLGRNVTLYFFVAGLYLTSSMYGLLPPMIYPPKDGGIKPPTDRVQILQQLAQAEACATKTPLKPSDFGELAAFEGRRDRGVHQQFREMLGRMIQLIDALADELVVTAGGGFLQRGHAGCDFRAFFRGQTGHLRICQRFRGRG